MNRSGADCVLAMDAGGTTIKLGLVRPGAAEALDFLELPIRSDGSAAEIGGDLAAAARAGAVRARARGLALRGVGISVPGPFDYAAGVSLMTHKWAAARGMQLRPLIQGEVGPIPVRFVSDSSAFLLGELVGGAWDAYRSPCAAIIGTGLGFAAIKDGEPLADPSGAPAFKIFRLPYRGGVAEDFVSKRAIMAAYSGAGGRAGTTVKEIAAAARAGEPCAAAAFREAARALAEIVAPIIMEYEFDCLLIGGQIGKAGALLTVPAEDRLAELSAPCPVRAARRIDEAPLLGAARALEEGG